MSDVGLVFPNSAGTPLHTVNVRERIWIPLLQRATPYRDMYSLRSTFVSLTHTSGEEAFKVARITGHSRSELVDRIYAHTVDSGIAGISETVEKRIALTPP